MTLPAITPPAEPKGLGKAEWRPIRDADHNHPLERAPSVETKDGVIWIRKSRHPDQKYVVLPTGKWHCAKCGAAVLSVGIAHPIWDGVGLCSGGGECWHEEAPYCPTCETKPGSTGSITRE